MKMKLNEEMENRKAVISRERERQKNLIDDTRRALEEYKASKLVIELLSLSIIPIYRKLERVRKRC